ncbi:CpsB/CapC family capsule biosynthesis tyrosine phosphatase [Neobacillus sp. OS1-32]|uniref:tyrosine-protein phosphatase n=1 Tax=Neobacillus sp. OS1-32 TaxID=3070682 RepID=UPI0027E20CFD|nr:CpsB/CapC family capsule biosynthesis tyrosine phosphatase [Neobacillus sp. OS1-32]WML30303.1 CpsB/CapC family capsule biosynthesis tyrosine phosphatase [Neobacillus sp. OS1-32]
MIDIHCHILPGIDDGPQHFHESIEMAKAAVEEGITHLFATPHHLNGQYENVKSDILNYVLSLNQHLQSEKIPITIHSGQEIRIHRELLFSLANDEILTLDNRQEYLLLELPSGEVPKYTLEMVYELKLRGLTPIIVHPERNRGFIENPLLLFEIIQEGGLTQLTAGSVSGHFGKKIKSFSETMIEHHLAHFIASDSHFTRSRGFFFQKAYDTITKRFGIQHTFYFKENAQLLLSGQHPHIEKPLPIRKKILGVF